MTDLVAEAVAELYDADPDDFMPRRGQLADAAKEAGQPDAAKQITGLRKPTRSAWVVNHLVRADPEVTIELAAMGTQLRGPGLDAARIRELTTARARLVDELTRRAFNLAGHSSPPAGQREEVSATFDAAIADPDVAGRLGTLVRAARWAGFGLDPDAPPPPLPPRPPKPKNPRRLRRLPRPSAAAARKSMKPNERWLKPTTPSTRPARRNSSLRTRSGDWKTSWPKPASSWPKPGAGPTGPKHASGGPT